MTPRTSNHTEVGKRAITLLADGDYTPLGTKSEGSDKLAPILPTRCGLTDADGAIFSARNYSVFRKVFG